MRHKIFILSLYVIGLGLVIFVLNMARYSIYPAGDQYAYRLDRWTGETTRLSGHYERNMIDRRD